MRAELRTTWDGARPWVELRSPRKGHWGDSQAIEEFFFFLVIVKKQSEQEVFQEQVWGPGGQEEGCQRGAGGPGCPGCPLGGRVLLRTLREPGACKTICNVLLIYFFFYSFFFF